MSIGAVTRTSSGAESHVSTSKTDGNLIHYSNDGEDVSLGGSSTGTVLNAQGASGAAALGTFLTCESYQFMCFSIAYAAPTGVRRFQVAFKDWHATPGYFFPDNMRFTPTNLGIRDDTTVVLATLKATYYHGTSIIVPCLGMKEATLLLLGGGTGDGAVAVWGAPT